MGDWQIIALALYVIPVIHRMTVFHEMTDWAREVLQDEVDGEKLAPIVVPVFAFCAIAFWPLADAIEALGNLFDPNAGEK